MFFLGVVIAVVLVVEHTHLKIKESIGGNKAE